jgi:UDP-4-amino-4,6-dideoxy-N-acetyl-beta-L-altrosamine N-acetyltransferase
MQTNDQAVVLSWRNHPSIRSLMFSTHEIKPEEHAAWFKRCAADASRKLVIFETNGSPQGFTNLYIEPASHNAEWGFYVAPDAPKGTGSSMANAVIERAFIEWHVHKITGQVLAANGRSRAFHAKLGFQLEGILRHHHFDGAAYHDVYHYGLLAEDHSTTPTRTPV